MSLYLSLNNRRKWLSQNSGHISNLCLSHLEYFRYFPFNLTALNFAYDDKANSHLNSVLRKRNATSVPEISPPRIRNQSLVEAPIINSETLANAIQPRLFWSFKIAGIHP